MPWLFLAVSVYGAVYTLNAFEPIRRSRLLFLWSFFSSWLTIEGALFHVAWQVALSALFVAGGALEQWPGWVALGISIASWIGLVVLYVRSRGTDALVAEAFGEFGAEVLPGVEGRRRRVNRIKDIEYTKAGGRRLCLDVYEPAEPPHPGTRRPAVVQIHGGAWILGSKNEQGIPLLRHLAANGWVGFNVDYRLSPTATWPEHLIDCKRAIAWIREHAEEFGVDPDFIAVTGGSAGGHLTAMVALTANDPEYQPGFEEADTSVQAAVPFYGVYDFTNRNGSFPPEFQRWLLEPFVLKAFMADEPERFRAASPLDQVHAEAPPFLIVHGTKDTLAPVVDARQFADHLRAVSGSEVFYVELHGAQHAFDVFRSPRTNRTIRGVRRFLEAVHVAWRTGVDPALAPPDDTSAPPAEADGSRQSGPVPAGEPA